MLPLVGEVMFIRAQNYLHHFSAHLGNKCHAGVAENYNAYWVTC